jgi:hypothetical protein
MSARSRHGATQGNTRTDGQGDRGCNSEESGVISEGLDDKAKYSKGHHVRVLSFTTTAVEVGRNCN